MPTYEYKCDNCGHRFERFQSIKADAIRKCPKCGKNAVHRLISGGGGLIFKGSGFYSTDYRDASYADKAKADSGDAKPAEKGGQSTGNESKPSESKASESKAGESKASADVKAKPPAKSKSEAKPAKVASKNTPAAEK